MAGSPIESTIWNKPETVQPEILNVLIKMENKGKSPQTIESVGKAQKIRKEYRHQQSRFSREIHSKTKSEKRLQKKPMQCIQNLLRLLPYTMGQAKIPKRYSNVQVPNRAET